VERKQRTYFVLKNVIKKQEQNIGKRKGRGLRNEKEMHELANKVKE